MVSKPSRYVSRRLEDYRRMNDEEIKMTEEMYQELSNGKEEGEE